MRKKRMFLLVMSMALSAGMMLQAGAAETGNMWDHFEKLIEKLGQEDSDRDPQKKDPWETDHDLMEPEVFESGDYQYTVNKDKESVTIAGYTGDEGAMVEVPSALDGYTVTDIGYQAFTYKKMKGLSIPEGLRSIGERAFEYCVIEDTLELPENVDIQKDAFSYAKLPSVIVIPEGAVVEECAFSYCDTIEQVLIGPGAFVKGRGFGYCYHLEQVVCGDGSRLETNGVEYCDRLETVILCGTVHLGEDAFAYCDQAKITNADAEEFERLAPETSGTPDEGSAGALLGGWTGTEDAEISEEAQDVFNQAMDGYDGRDYEAVALLATQVVRGRNYCFLSRTGGADSGETPAYQLVYIWQDIDGTLEVLDVQEITFAPGDEESGPVTVPQSEDEYRITLTGDEYVFVDCPSTARAGDIVTVHTVDVADGEVKIEVNGLDSGTWEEWGTYTFIMPEEDVELHGWISTAGYPGA